MLRTRRWTWACGVTAEFTTARNTTRWSTNRIPARQAERYFANSPVGFSHPSPRERAERESKSFLERPLSSSAALAVASWARAAAGGRRGGRVGGIGRRAGRVGGLGGRAGRVGLVRRRRVLALRLLRGVLRGQAITSPGSGGGCAGH